MRERSDMSLQLRERETEILTLQAQVRCRYYAVLAPPFLYQAHSSSNQPDSNVRELEGRLHELTESLIQKQTALETLSSERNSLNLQLEKTKVRTNKVN